MICIFGLRPRPVHLLTKALVERARTLVQLAGRGGERRYLWQPEALVGAGCRRRRLCSARVDTRYTPALGFYPCTPPSLIRRPLVVVAATNDLLYGRSNEDGLALLVGEVGTAPSATYMLELSSVRALLVTQGRVRLDNAVLDEIVQLQLRVSILPGPNASNGGHSRPAGIFPGPGGPGTVGKRAGCQSSC